MQEVYDRYGRALIRKAERILGSRDDALDVVHSLFVDLVDEPADRDLDLPYLYRAVTNRCLTLLRDEKNRTRLLAEHDVALRGPVRTRLDDRAVDLDLLAKLVARLDAVEGEILALHVFDDMTQDAASPQRGPSPWTIAGLACALGAMLPDVSLDQTATKRIVRLVRSGASRPKPAPGPEP